MIVLHIEVIELEGIGKSSTNPHNYIDSAFLESVDIWRRLKMIVVGGNKISVQFQMPHAWLRLLQTIQGFLKLANIVWESWILKMSWLLHIKLLIEFSIWKSSVNLELEFKVWLAKIENITHRGTIIKVGANVSLKCMSRICKYPLAITCAIDHTTMPWASVFLVRTHFLEMISRSLMRRTKVQILF